VTGDRSEEFEYRMAGAIMPGHRADLHVIDAPSVSHFAYRPGMHLTFGVWEAGVRVR
jgi:imidazolonepropionase